MTVTPPTNDYEAFVLALRLACTAPTETQAIKATNTAEHIATKLTPVQIDQAKNEVAAYVDQSSGVRRMLNRRIGIT